MIKQFGHEPATLLQDQSRASLDFDDAAGDDEETLSFCDLPLNSESWDQQYCYSSSTHNLQTSSSSDHQDLFEFIRIEDFGSTEYYVRDHIIFCGKRIPDKVAKSGERPQPKDTNKTTSNKTTSNNVSRQDEVYYYYNGSAKRSSSSKSSRWYFLSSGLMGKVPMEMSLSDIKARQTKMMTTKSSRQEKKITSKCNSVKNGNGEMINKSCEQIRGDRSSSIKGLGRLIRVMSCKDIVDTYATPTVKASHYSM